MAAITAAVIGAGTAIYAAKKNADAQKKQQEMQQQAIDASDPFRTYRPEYAAKLDKLMNDPSSIVDTPEYKARLTAASRALAAQGYTGSGNAIVEAANGGGQAFQQALQNLGVLSGASTGQLGGGYAAAMQSAQNGNEQSLSSIAGIGNNLANVALTVGQRFNQPSSNYQVDTSTQLYQPNNYQSPDYSSMLNNTIQPIQTGTG